MQPVTKTVFHGDTRDSAKMTEHDGFIPIYLLNPHADGFKGFRDCGNKTAGMMGCGCPLTSKTILYRNARTEFLRLLETPMDVQKHIMFNNMGYLSTALGHDDAYGGHQYKINVNCYEFSLEEARARYRVTRGRVTNLVRPYKVYIDTVNVADATILGFAARGGVELTFVSPVPMSNLTYTGLV